MVRLSLIVLACLQIALFFAVTEAICSKCFCIISFRPLCGLQEGTGRVRVFSSVCVLNCSNKCFRKKFKFLHYGRCVKSDMQKRKTTTSSSTSTTTTTVSAISGKYSTIDAINSTTTTTKSTINFISSTINNITTNNDNTTIGATGTTTTSFPIINLETTKAPIPVTIVSVISDKYSTIDAINSTTTTTKSTINFISSTITNNITTNNDNTTIGATGTTTTSFPIINLETTKAPIPVTRSISGIS